MVARAEASAAASGTVEDNRDASAHCDTRSGPRQIQIVDDSESLSEEERQAEALRKEVEKLRQELKKLK
jgi:polyhydroxyalkanoate synthesis regulator phasin